MHARALRGTAPAVLLSIVAPVSTVRHRNRRHTVGLRTAPAVYCVLDQPWAEFLQPGDWIEVVGEPWKGTPSTVDDRVVLVRCAAALAFAQTRSATFRVTGTAEELDLHGRYATITLAFHGHGKIRTLQVRARPDQAVDAFLSRRQVRAEGRITVARSGRVFYIAEQVHTGTKEEVA